jgi:hypothetical protein
MRVREVMGLLTSVALLLLRVDGGGVASAGEQTSAPSLLSDHEAELLLRVVTAEARRDVVREGTASGVRCGRYEPPRLTSTYFIYRCEFVGATPETASTLVGNYLVNRWTAEVWDFGPIERVTGLTLEKLQAKLRRQHAISQDVMKRYTDAPFFEVDDRSSTSNYCVNLPAGGGAEVK